MRRLGSDRRVAAAPWRYFYAVRMREVFRHRLYGVGGSIRLVAHAKAVS